jgi:hypothetical protein
MPLAVGPILTYAIYWSPLRFIEELLAIGADPNGHDHDGFRPSSPPCARRIHRRGAAHAMTWWRCWRGC